MKERIFDLVEIVKGLSPELKAEIEEARGEWLANDGPKSTDEWEKRQRESRIETIYRYSGMTDGDRKRTFQSFEVNDDNRDAHSIAKMYLDTWPESGEGGTGFIVMGDVGVGKTHLCLALLNALIQKGVICEYASVKETLDSVKFSYDQQNVADPTARLRKKELLLLDDLGRERSTDWTLDEIAKLIRYRYSKQLPTLYTTNALNWKDLVTMISPPGREFDAGSLVDRMIERTEAVVMKGSSRRQPLRKFLKRR